MVTGAASGDDSIIRVLLRGLRSTTLLDATRNKPRPVLATAAFAPPQASGLSVTLVLILANEVGRGGGI